MSDFLTARFVETVKPKATRQAYADGRVPGLALRVATTGAKSWALRYRIGRRLRRWTIGTYPAVSLANARDQAKDAVRAIGRGHDPALTKAERREADTFGELADRYLEEYAKPRKRSWKDDRRILRSEILPHWRHRLAADVRRRDVRELVDAVARRGAPILANRVRALLHTLYRYAESVEVVGTNPVVGVPRPGVERQRDRVLTEDEIRQFWTALDDVPTALAAAFRLRLITAQRGGEVVSMRWADIDLGGGWWTIPASDSKNRLPHRVPLTTPALVILGELRATATKTAVFVVGGARGKRQRAGVVKRIGLTDFRGHDLRRTAASQMASVGVSRLVIGKVLNHVERGVTAVYDRHTYDAEKRRALEAWERRLTQILEERASGAVVPFVR